MIQLEEAGEEDLCGLLNQVVGLFPYYGSGIDLAEYLEAIDLLERQGELRVRSYQIVNGYSVLGAIRTDSAIGAGTSFRFDADELMWKWLPTERLRVELPS